MKEEAYASFNYQVIKFIVIYPCNTACEKINNKQKTKTKQNNKHLKKHNKSQEHGLLV